MNDPARCRVGSREGRAVSVWLSRRKVVTLGAASAAGAALPLVGGAALPLVGGGPAMAAPDFGGPAGGPGRIFDVTHFGARGDGVTIDSGAINRAIDAAAAGPRPGGT